MPNNTFIRNALIALSFFLAGCSQQGLRHGEAESINILNNSLQESEKTLDAPGLISGTRELFPEIEGLPTEKEVINKASTLPRVVDMPEPSKSPLGRASVAMLVDEYGDVIKARVLSSSSGAAALYAKAFAMEIKFTPATVDGRPIKFAMTFPIVAY